LGAQAGLMCILDTGVMNGTPLTASCEVR